MARAAGHGRSAPGHGSRTLPRETRRGGCRRDAALGPPRLGTRWHGDGRGTRVDVTSPFPSPCRVQTELPLGHTLLLALLLAGAVHLLQPVSAQGFVPLG